MQSEPVGIRLLYKITPDEIKDILAVIAMNWRADRFQLGDIANHLRETVAEHLYPVTDEDVYIFMAECLQHEVSPRTIRGWARVTKFFDLNKRAKYENMPFSHLLLAMSYGDRWAEVLDYSLAEGEKIGKLLSVEFLTAHFSGIEIASQEPSQPPDVVYPDYPEPPIYPDTEPVVDEERYNDVLRQILRIAKMALSFSMPKRINKLLADLIDEIEKIAV